VALAGPLALDVLGDGYRRAGAAALVLLAVALLPDAVTNVVVAVWRVRRRYGPAIAVNTGMAVAAVGGAVAWGPGAGARGAATAWLAAQAAGAVAATTWLVLDRGA
jgi:hypothetical protein